MNTSSDICLAAGGLRFAAAWFGTGSADWNVAIATTFVALMFGAIERADQAAGVGLSLMFAIGALTISVKGSEQTPITVIQNKLLGGLTISAATKKAVTAHRPTVSNV
jgi:hypothetical protein